MKVIQISSETSSQGPFLAISDREALTVEPSVCSFALYRMPKHLLIQRQYCIAGRFAVVILFSCSILLVLAIYYITCSCF